MAVGAVFGFLFGAAAYWLGLRNGYRRGVNDQPQKVRDELAQLRFERGVAEERYESEQRVSKHFELALLEAVRTKQ